MLLLIGSREEVIECRFCGMHVLLQVRHPTLQSGRWSQRFRAKELLRGIALLVV
jgi:DNA-directed RNA polymerase subunit RPC12/RpoP